MNFLSTPFHELEPLFLRFRQNQRISQLQLRLGTSSDTNYHLHLDELEQIETTNPGSNPAKCEFVSCVACVVLAKFEKLSIRVSEMFLQTPHIFEEYGENMAGVGEHELVDRS